MWLLNMGNAGKTVIVSTQPYFYKKAELFPGSAFVIGADTAVRLVNVRSIKFLMVFFRSIFQFVSSKRVDHNSFLFFSSTSLV